MIRQTARLRSPEPGVNTGPCNWLDPIRPRSVCCVLAFAAGLPGDARRAAGVDGGARGGGMAEVGVRACHHRILPAGFHRCPIHHAVSEENHLARSNDCKEIATAPVAQADQATPTATATMLTQKRKTPIRWQNYKENNVGNRFRTNKRV
jgi:hypothetical protein